MPPLKNYQQWIELEIKKQRYGKQPPSLYEPIRYLMHLGGKRLRPMLTLLSYSLFRDDVRRAVPVAVAVEAFHNFTLMHDDIMDKAPLRRGKPTVHEKWNVNTAILSGDVMLVKVYDMFLQLEPETLKTVLGPFNQCAAEVCEGQQWDMDFETTSRVTEAQYINMIRLKTAVLLGFSLELGAILAGAGEEDRKALREFGTNIGIGFQLKDDVLDAYADPKKFGKQVGGDIIANKKTFLLIQALQKAKGKTKAELTRWLAAQKFRKQEKVNAVKAIYDQLGVAASAEKKIDHFFTKGFKSLEGVRGNEAAKDLLKNFTQALIERQS
ncbi:polyprenyl synthetase family protein [Fulvivirgaceae bacterium PWU4]|uniref:Polyprenyl synthetase family protein n=1 Tax=Chryseosolibacter histidini TaxID=2782349 RepID=A0AAP2DLS0_9BACT|nr:polyprenyl synthetase family protein [Chryseosolibacter histidini]MBT1697257.1 polyprenyl synthetase family protein [Chryseosolibacter histidini]